MKQIISAAIAAVALLGTGLALAQTQPANNSTTPPAIARGNDDSKAAAAPVAGKNSFTEARRKTALQSTAIRPSAG
jgi:hypothetical protein